MSAGGWIGVGYAIGFLITWIAIVTANIVDDDNMVGEAMSIGCIVALFWPVALIGGFVYGIAKLLAKGMKAL